MYWLTADWHFGHEKMVSLSQRPADFENLIRERHSEALSTGDVLVNLGDVALGKDGTARATWFLEDLRDRGISVVCCKGNHDESSAKLRKMGFDFVCDSFAISRNKFRLLFQHEPIVGRFCSSGDPRCVHGHLHLPDGHRGSGADGNLLISMELLDYRPIKLDTLLKIDATPKWEKGRFVKWTPSPSV